MKTRLLMAGLVLFGGWQIGHGAYMLAKAELAVIDKELNFADDFTSEEKQKLEDIKPKSFWTFLCRLE